MKFLYLLMIFALVFSLNGCGKKTSGTNNTIPKDYKELTGELNQVKQILPIKNEEYYVKKVKHLAPTEVIQIQKDSDAGNAESQVMMAFIYAIGIGAPKDYPKAFKLLRTAAENGHDLAQLLVGQAFMQGITKEVAIKEGKLEIKKDIPMGLDFIQKSASQGNADAQMYLGDLYSKGNGVEKDSTKAIKWWERAALQGDSEQQYALAEKFRDGKVVSKNMIKAAEWFEKSAQQGNVIAQARIGQYYIDGLGVPKDYAKGIKYFRKAAAQGNSYSQLSLGNFYEDGKVIERNLVYAYAWYNLATANFPLAKANRDSVELKLSSSQRAKGQLLASNWKKGDMYLDGETSSVTRDGKSGKHRTGTAFTVSSEGYALTNYHVIDGCSEVRVSGRKGVAKVITSDNVNDLALLQLPGKTYDFASLNSDPAKLRQGENIVVFGYPLNSELSLGGNFTPGTLSALYGFNNNTNQIQITAPIQPGSSGSPVMDKKGNVVGMVSMKLDGLAMANTTRQIRENINYAINGQTVKAFLEANNIRYKTGGGLFSFEKSNADIAQEARKWTVLVECWN
jgi:TPR repeat protein